MESLGAPETCGGACFQQGSFIRFALHVGEVEHHDKLQRRVFRRSFEARESARNSVFKKNHIRPRQIRNRTRSALHLEWNGDKVGLDVKRWLGGLLRSLLSHRYA